MFERHESQVRYYARLFPVLFERAEGSRLYDDQGREYIDFLCGAGNLNYGHNNPWLRESLTDYSIRAGITDSLDPHTAATQRFIETLHDRILAPRRLDYVVQFTGPTGTTAVEAALERARKLTGRHPIAAFTNGFHGTALKTLAATGTRHHRSASGSTLTDVVRLPFDGYLGTEIDTIAYAETLLTNAGSGVDRPAAVILETVQCEGGLNVASIPWLQRMERLCRELQILLIVDDTHAGCGRTGTFFSFESAGIRPDMVILSKSLSGFGLPFAVTLIARHHAAHSPDKHRDTLLGHNLAFVTATEALVRYWTTGEFAETVARRAELLQSGLRRLADSFPGPVMDVRGRGMMCGLRCADGALADKVLRAAFQRGLIVETCGAHHEVIKCLPALTISENVLLKGLAILEEAIVEAVSAHRDPWSSDPVQRPADGRPYRTRSLSVHFPLSMASAERPSAAAHLDTSRIPEQSPLGVDSRGHCRDFSPVFPRERHCAPPVGTPSRFTVVGSLKGRPSTPPPIEPRLV